MYLVKPWNIRPLPKVAASGRNAPFTTLALNGEFRASITKNNKVHLAPISIANEAQFHIIPLGVLNEVAVLQQVPGHHVLEPSGIAPLDSPLLPQMMSGVTLPSFSTKSSVTSEVPCMGGARVSPSVWFATHGFGCRLVTALEFPRPKEAQCSSKTHLSKL